MFTCIAKFFATLTSVFSMVHTVATVGEDYADLFKAESDYKLRAKRRELNAQIALEPVSEPAVTK